MSDEHSSNSIRDAAIDLIRRLPPRDVENNLSLLKIMMPGHDEFLMSSVDVPIKVHVCEKTKREYLSCQVNCHQNSYRSPWSNEYYPRLDKSVPPPPTINAAARNLEIYANHAFNTYRHLYYQGGMSSAYVWNTDKGYGAAVLIKYTSDQPHSINGVWDSIHIAEMKKKPAHGSHPPSYVFYLTSTILLFLSNTGQDSRLFNLSGNVTRRCMSEIVIKDEKTQLVENLGRLIEEQESKLRSFIFEIYCGKIKDVIFKLKLALSVKETQKQKDLQKSVINKIYMPGKDGAESKESEKSETENVKVENKETRRNPTSPLQLTSDFKTVSISSSPTASSPRTSPLTGPLIPPNVSIGQHNLRPTKKTG